MREPVTFRMTGTATGFMDVSFSAGDRIEHPLLGICTVPIAGVYRLTEHGVVWLRPADNEGDTP